MKNKETNFNLRKLQLVQLRILIELDKICKENNIKYQLFSGTLLGAVRHKAFIAWDDDIDVAMLRKDYDKFLKVCQENLDKKYFLQTHKTDKEYIHPFARIRKNNTLSLQEHWAEIDMHHGIFIDVFPMDNILPDKFIGRLQYHFLYSLRNIKAFKTKRECLITKNPIQRYLKLLAHYLLKPFSIQSINKLETKIMCIFQNRNTEYSSCLSEGKKQTYHSYMIKNEDFYKTKDRDFEGYKFPIPKNYHEVLTNNFGDYMKPPPIEEQKPHHGIIELIFDTRQTKALKGEV